VIAAVRAAVANAYGQVELEGLFKKQQALGTAWSDGVLRRVSTVGHSPGVGIRCESASEVVGTAIAQECSDGSSNFEAR
jgi:hypothetical protein